MTGLRALVLATFVSGFMVSPANGAGQLLASVFAGAALPMGDLESAYVGGPVGGVEVAMRRESGLAIGFEAGVMSLASDSGTSDLLVLVGINGQTSMFPTAPIRPILKIGIEGHGIQGTEIGAMVNVGAGASVPFSSRLEGWFLARYHEMLDEPASTSGLVTITFSLVTIRQSGGEKSR